MPYILRDQYDRDFGYNFVMDVGPAGFIMTDSFVRAKGYDNYADADQARHAHPKHAHKLEIVPVL